MFTKNGRIYFNGGSVAGQAVFRISSSTAPELSGGGRRKKARNAKILPDVLQT